MSATEPIQITPAAEAPQVLAPVADSVFSVRARRFDQLAAGHSLGDWLCFLAALTRAQHDALQSMPPLSLPDAEELTLAREHGMPPLPAQSWPRPAVWREVLKTLCVQLAPDAPEIARKDLARLQSLPAEVLEALAARVLNTELYGEDAALLPYVAAALQVLWTAAAARLGGEIAALDDVHGVCPCCGSLPVASVVRSSGAANLRYLHCSLCNTEWNLVRVKCASCDATAGISYRHIEGGKLAHLPAEAVCAETCDSCKSYLKIVYQEKGGVDAVADDLATLALDILVDEAGYSRSGPNLLLVPSA
jgi:FdhE protein